MNEIKTEQDFLAQMEQFNEELAEMNKPIREEMDRVNDVLDGTKEQLLVEQLSRTDYARQWNELTTKVREAAAKHNLIAKKAQAQYFGLHEAAVELAKIAEAKEAELAPLRASRFEVEKKLQDVNMAILTIKQQRAKAFADYHELERKRKENCHVIHNKKHELIERYPKGTLE